MIQFYMILSFRSLMNSSAQNILTPILNTSMHMYSDSVIKIKPNAVNVIKKLNDKYNVFSANPCKFLE